MILLDAGRFPRTQREVLERLIEEMHDGSLLSGDALGTEVALAARFGVSRNTIRSLMSTLEDAGAVRQLPRRGIFLNSLLRLQNGSAGGGEDRQFLYLRWCDSLMESEITCGLERFARQRQLPVRVLNMHQSEELLCDTLRQLPPECTAVLVPPELPGVVRELNAAIRRGARILQADRYLGGVAAPSITFDDYSIGVLATRHLIRQANRPVWFFGYTHPVSAQKRYQGWADSMRESGFGQLPDYRIPCDTDNPLAEMLPQQFFLDSFRDFYRRHDDAPISIFCIGDSLAFHVYRVAEEFKRRVGSDILLVGSGDTARGQRLNPPLSSIHAEQELMGEAIGSLLQHWPASPQYSQILPLELIPRASSLGVEA